MNKSGFVHDPDERWKTAQKFWPHMSHTVERFRLGDTVSYHGSSEKGTIISISEEEQLIQVRYEYLIPYKDGEVGYAYRYFKPTEIDIVCVPSIIHKYKIVGHDYEAVAGYKALYGGRNIKYETT